MNGDPFELVTKKIDEEINCPIFASIKYDMARHFLREGGCMYVLMTRDCFRALVEELKPYHKAPTLEIGGRMTVRVPRTSNTEEGFVDADIIVLPKATYLQLKEIVAYEYLVVGNPGHEFLYGKDIE